jgi:hypothetical protein
LRFNLLPQPGVSTIRAAPQISRDPLHEASCQDAYQQYDDEGDSRVRKAVHWAEPFSSPEIRATRRRLSLAPMEEIERPDEAVDQTGRATDLYPLSH